MTTTILGIHFAAYENIFYFYLIAGILLLLLYQVKKRNQQIRKLVGMKYVSMLLANYSYSNKIIKMMLMLVGSSLVIATLLHPQWDKKEEVISQQGRDILIAIDISRSMLAQDVKPNRLEFAKAKIKKLLYNLPCERVGLIVFSSSTFVQCPLTTDFGAFFMFLDKLDIDTISHGSTAIDQVIKEGLRVFDATPDKKTKLLLVFTDGEDFSTDLAGVKERVVKDRLSICTVGIGTTLGAPVPIINEKNKQTGWEKDAQGNVVMSCLNEKLLTTLALESGGKYVHAQPCDDDIIDLIATINTFEKDLLDDKSVESYQEQYPYFIAISFLCFALEWIL